MAQKFLLGPIFSVVFHVSCSLIHLVLESEFASDIKDVTLANEKRYFYQLKRFIC